MQSNARTVEEYLQSLPEDKKISLEQVRDVILSRLPEGYEEVMNWGMISYQVPLERFPDTYNGKPLLYAALAAQKNHMAVYLSGIYISEERRKRFEEAYRRTGKRFDTGKSCVRFKKLEDLPLDLIGEAIADMPVEMFTRQVEKARSRDIKNKGRK